MLKPFLRNEHRATEKSWLATSHILGFRPLLMQPDIKSTFVLATSRCVPVISDPKPFKI